MNWSKYSIIFRGKQYDCPGNASKDTGVSVYNIKKEMELVNPNDREKWESSGRKKNTLLYKPSKEELESIYRGNLREVARHYSVSVDIIRDLFEEYGIKLLSLGEAKILRADLERPSKEELESFYSTHSIPETCKKFGKIGRAKLIRWLKHYDIPVKGLGKTASIKNSFRRETVRPTKDQLIEDYRTNNMYKLALKYGVDKGILRDWFDEYGIEVTRRDSKLENYIYEFCKNLCPSFVQGDRTIIAPYELDVVSAYRKLAIEVCGTYWHSTAIRADRNYHKKKYDLCKSAGIELLTIFESDDLTKVEALIKRKLGLKSTRVYARSCSIKSIDNTTAEKFNLDHHLNDHVRSSLNYGIYYNNELVMVGSFGKSRYNKNYDWECIRLTSHSDYSVIGGVSRIFKNFIRDHDVSSCITYADLRFGEGLSYLNCGFSREKDTGPNYFYVVNGRKYSRVKYQKHKLKALYPDIYSNELTEEQIMHKAGHSRIYDCGNAVYTFDK